VAPRSPVAGADHVGSLLMLDGSVSHRKKNTVATAMIGGLYSAHFSPESPTGSYTMRTKFWFGLCFLTVLLVGSARAQSPLNNDSVTKMVKAGLGEETVVSMIKSQPGSYKLDPDTIIQLKAAGVSEKILDAMIEKNSGGSSPTAAPATVSDVVTPSSLGVDEVGVYYKNKDNKWVEILPEVVNWKTGGVLKHFASEGIVKGDINGHIEGKTSKNALNTPLDFLIYMSEGVAVTEYQLLRLRESGNGREFRSTTGGVVHSSGGAKRDEVDFEARKIGPRLYEVVLKDVKSGDFGFLPPGAMSSSNMASSGKIYSFHVIE